MERIASITRDTNETQISMSLNLDGSGRGNINTGIGFFDHMLNSFARHGFFDLDLTVKGDLETEMVREFFYAVSYGAEMNLHLKQLSGTNNHHIIEAAFKAFAKALDGAVAAEPRLSGVLSTKGSL